MANPIRAEVAQLNREDLVQEAVAIGRQILERRLYSGSGNVAWVGPTGYGTELTPLRVVQLGPHLYDGTAGIALFFAALERVQGDGEFRGASLEAIAPLRRKLGELASDPERASRIRIPLGGLIGLGSFIYSLLRIGELLDEPVLFGEAHKVTVLITPDRIAKDDRVRLQTGCAGAILALLALHEKIPGPNRESKSPLQLAFECAHHLLASRIFFDSRTAAWALSPGKPPLAGFSYGAAGISYALLRLYEKTAAPELWNAAQEGLAFVRSLYSPKHRNWRDARVVFQSRYHPRHGTWKDWWASGTFEDLEEQSPEPESQEEPHPEDRFLDMWCHGASGIALGRIGALRINDSQEIRDEIRGAVERARSCAGSPEMDHEVDDLCCGYLGRVELLLGAYSRLGDQTDFDAARMLMNRVWSRARERGGYQLSAARGTDAFAPSLFQGIAGVGYSWLRLAEPTTLPCLLLLE